METPSNTFVPKYHPATYIWLLIYVVGFVLLITLPIVRSSMFPGEENWVGIYWGLGFGIAALYEGSKLIRAIEFGENEMSVHFRIRGQKIIDYTGIKRINIEWSYIDSIKSKIYFHDMENQDELLTKIAGILNKKNIKDISLEEEEKKALAVVYRRLRFALIFTVAIGLVAEFIGNADWSYFYIILILYFVLIYQVLRLFIK